MSHVGHVRAGDGRFRESRDKALLALGSGWLAESAVRAVWLRTALEDLLAAVFWVPELIPFHDVNTAEERAAYA